MPIFEKGSVVRLSDEDRDLLRQIRDRLPAPATENDYQAVTVDPEAIAKAVRRQVRLTEDDRDYTHP